MREFSNNEKPTRRFCFTFFTLIAKLDQDPNLPMEQTTKQRSRSLLEKLPLHLLFLIAACLAELQLRTRRSIFALSLVSKTCNEATDPERFRHMHLVIVGPQKLLRDTQHWRQILQVGPRLRFVHSIKIIGVTISPSVEEELIEKDDISGSTLPIIQAEKHTDNWGRNKDADEEVRELFSGMDRRTCGNLLLPALPSAWSDDSAWKPLVDLVSDLPALQDVVWASRNQFPRPLLSEMHEHHTHCRLHMHHFKLHSLIMPERAEQKMHPDDMALATSPCLYSVIAQTQPYNSAKILDYNEEAIRDMVKGAAPNLKNVSITHGVHQSAPGLFSTIPRPPWKGFQVLATRPQSPIGRLENLAANHDMAGEQLLQWSHCTDFRHLRSFKAGSCFDISAVRRLVEISRQTPLEALSLLSLKLLMDYSFGETDAMVDPVVAELLQCLRPLETIYLEGYLGEKSFEAITTHHAERLRSLTFLCVDANVELFKFPPERAAQLSRDCPRLEMVDVKEPKLLTSNGFFDWTDWGDEI